MWDVVPLVNLLPDKLLACANRKGKHFKQDSWNQIVQSKYHSGQKVSTLALFLCQAVHVGSTNQRAKMHRGIFVLPFGLKSHSSMEKLTPLRFP